MARNTHENPWLPGMEKEVTLNSQEVRSKTELEPISVAAIESARDRYLAGNKERKIGCLAVYSYKPDGEEMIGFWDWSIDNPNELSVFALEPEDDKLVSKYTKLMKDPEFIGLTSGGVPKYRYHGDRDPTDMGISR